ncbi:cupin domain-containing protein [Rhizobium leucaenae]|uniref:cupin domain-containing protein n=1 Tax=Rhizobium leucaenae TaxID=29450 RepID=UPI001616961C|nr:cupin domain-containing protein [Rhizobium leucaenae]MBB6305061.1 mannose-6-phosphate isomerase-like protein (cupin superfamily) [Rhizobium leucaenae]
MSEKVHGAGPALAPDVRRIRRVITGHDRRGRSVIVSDDASPHATPFMGMSNFAVTDLWKSGSTPAENGAGTASDPCGLPIVVAPPNGGSVFRVTQFPPEKDWHSEIAGAGDALRLGPVGNNRHPHMHRTQTLDYAIVVSGEIWVMMDEGETRLSAGDVVIQRGTRHAWANRSEKPCVVAFVMIDALPLE